MSNVSKAALAGRVRNHRVELKMTQKGLAESAGIARQTVMNLEHGESLPPIRVLERVFEALGLPFITGLTGVRVPEGLGEVGTGPVDDRVVGIYDGPATYQRHIRGGQAQPTKTVLTDLDGVIEGLEITDNAMAAHQGGITAGATVLWTPLAEGENLRPGELAVIAHVTRDVVRLRRVHGGPDGAPVAFSAESPYVSDIGTVEAHPIGRVCEIRLPVASRLAA